MNGPAIGSLFSGAGALCELAVAPLLGGRVAWHCEFEPPTKKNPKPRQAAARVLAHRFPGTPNLGDITAVDWASVEPVEVLAGGFPCTDISSAGKRAGLRPDTRSGLWSHMAYGISVLRPRLVVIENVRGLASSPAHSDMEPCPWCLGDGPDQHALRALGAVLGDLADLGYDAVWCGLRAADVGACHGRFRFVILAAPADTAELGRGTAGRDDGVRAAGLRQEPAADTAVPRWAQLQSVDVDERGGRPDGVGPAEPGRRDRAPADANGEGRLGPGLPGADLRGVDRPATGRDDREPLLPTPRASDGVNHDGTTLTDAVWQVDDGRVDWGLYEPAIRRHELWLGRTVPHPTITGARGGKKLNPQLSEWMMGWPAGWVTDVPGLTPNDALQVCGNGVVPQQMAAGIRYLLPILNDCIASEGAA